MLTKEIGGEYVTVNPNGVLNYRLVENIVEDGNIVAQTNWRTTYEPKADMSNLPARCLEIAQTIWTPEAIEAYTTEKEATEKKADT